MIADLMDESIKLYTKRRLLHLKNPTGAARGRGGEDAKKRPLRIGMDVFAYRQIELRSLYREGGISSLIYRNVINVPAEIVGTWIDLGEAPFEPDLLT